jgi:hypothetical protein
MATKLKRSRTPTKRAAKYKERTIEQNRRDDARVIRMIEKRMADYEAARVSHGPK